MKKILAIFFLFAITACGQSNSKNKSTTQQDKIEDWKTYEDSNYTIQYPPNWELDLKGEMRTSFILFSPSENENDKFIENVNLIIQDLKGMNMNMDKYVEISEEQLKTMITNSVLIESKRVKDKNPEYHKLIYTGNQESLQFQFEQYLWIINEKAYILTLTCEINKFSEYKEVGEKILNSFSLTN